MELAFLITGVLVFVVFFLPIFQQVLNLGNAVGMLVGILLFAVGLTADKMDFTQKKWATFISAGLLALCVYACVSVFKSSVKLPRSSIFILSGKLTFSFGKYER